MSRSVRRGNFSNGVYAAEFEVFERNPRGPACRPMALADARALVERYCSRVRVERKRGTKRGDTAGSYFPELGDVPERIKLGTDAPKWVVLHEIAHAMTWERERGHGAVFRREYLMLVEMELGPWWARRLRAAFRKVGY